MKAALLDTSGEAVFRLELDHTVSSWNRAAEDLYGWNAADAVGMSAREALHANVSRFDESRAETLRTRHWAGELEQITREGRRVVGDCRWQLASHPDGSPSFILCAVSNTGASRRAEESRYRAQRMESLGTLAGGIAHDLNNVLAPILITAQLLAADEPEDHKRLLLSNIETSVRRGAEMTRQVLAFARGEDRKRTALSVDSVIDDLEAFCRDTLPKSIEVKVRRDGALWPVIADSTQIMQVLMNLVTNARDAMPDGGVLTIGARNRTGLLGAAINSDAEFVVIEVEDTGTGIGADTISKVFEPFFTTKPLGAGTGLGLSTSIAIVRGHGGVLDVYSEPDQGSRFEMKLPRAGAETPVSDKADVDAALLPLRGHGERILIVDDESAIRLIVQQTLAKNGYQTLVAADGIEAMTHLEEKPDSIDLVLTDMMMPIMDGAAIASYLLENHPDIPVVVASGLSSNAEVARTAHLGVRHFLLKPFSTEELLSALREALEDSRTRTTQLPTARDTSIPMTQEIPGPGMARMTYGGQVFVTTEEISTALIELATVLAQHRSAESVRVPVIDEEGRSTTVAMVIGPSSELISKPEPSVRTEIAGASTFLIEMRHLITTLTTGR